MDNTKQKTTKIALGGRGIENIENMIFCLWPLCLILLTDLRKAYSAEPELGTASLFLYY